MSRNFDNWNRYLDNNGKVLHGCIEVMVKDGNTPAAIYDRDGVALSNPQLTDNFGRSDHQIFIDADVVAYFYKYIGNGTLVDEQELGIDTSDQTKWNLQYTIENIFGVRFDLSSNTMTCIPNMTALRAVDPNVVPEIAGIKVITLLGYNKLGDKEPINYIWNPNSYANDNGGSVIMADSALTGRWIMVKPTEHVDSKHFGVFPQMSGSNYEYQTLKINNLFDYCNAEGLRPFFNGTDEAKYFAYTNLSAILKEPIDVSYGTTFVDDGTNALSIPSFNGDPIFKNHNTQLFTRTIKTKWNPKANSQYDEVIIDNNPGDMRSWTNKMVVIDEFHTGLSFNNCDMVVNDKISGTVTIENMEIKQEWFTTTYDWTNLTSINNRINLDNFSDPNVYITLKNKQHEADYGDLNEQTISNVTLLGGAIAENAYFSNVTLSGNTELHNVSGNVIIPSSPANINLIDCWLTFSNTANIVIDQFSIRRGNINLDNSYRIQVLSLLYIDNVDLNAQLYVYGVSNQAIKNSTITKTITSNYINLINCVIASDIISYDEIVNSNPVINFNIEGCKFTTGYHYLRSNNANAKVNGAWLNNDSTDHQPIIFNLEDGMIYNQGDAIHKYRYNGNTGKFLPLAVNTRIVNGSVGCFARAAHFLAIKAGYHSLLPAISMIYTGLSLNPIDSTWIGGFYISDNFSLPIQMFSIGTFMANVKMDVNINLTGVTGFSGVTNDDNRGNISFSIQSYDTNINQHGFATYGCEILQNQMINMPLPSPKSIATPGRVWGADDEGSWWTGRVTTTNMGTATLEIFIDRSARP